MSQASKGAHMSQASKGVHMSDASKGVHVDLLTGANDNPFDNELQEIKAKTMYQMVEEIPYRGSLKRLLYLTNSQAQMFNFNNIKTIVDAFETPRPQLVFKLLRSKYGISYCKWRKKCGNNDTITGVIDILTSTQSDRDITSFMEDTLIPMAAASNALILVQLLEEDTLLNCLCNAIDSVRKRYGPRLPFTVLGIDTALHFVQNTTRENCYTSTIVNHSSRWSQRMPIIKGFDKHFDTSQKHFNGLANLPEHVDNIIIVEGIDMPPSGYKGLCQQNFSITEELEQNVLYHFASTIPAVAFQTDRICGSSISHHILQFGVPTVFIDSRKRLNIPDNKRQNTEERVKEAIIIFTAFVNDICLRYRESPEDPFPVENLNACSVSYFHNVLYGDGNYAEGDMDFNDVIAGGNVTEAWLCHEIKNTEDKEQVINENGPTHEQICRVVDCITQTDMLFFYIKDNAAICRTQGESWDPLGDLNTLCPPTLDDSRDLRWRQFYSLITHPKFHHSHITKNPKALKELVRDLSRAGRLPKHNSYNGLLLLRRAWDTVDICTLVAWRYKVAAKVLYIFILCLGIILTVLSVLEAKSVSGGAYGNGLIFVLTVASTFIASIMAFKNPVHRWRNIRAAAQRMESYIWLYRTKVGRFEIPKYGSGESGPDKELSLAICEVRSHLAEVGNIKDTSFNEGYGRSAYRHGQYAPPWKFNWKQPFNWFLGQRQRVRPVKQVIDNHQSPVSPEQYIEFRIQTMLSFYQTRLPSYNRFHNLVHVVLLAASGLGSCISYYGYSDYIAIVAIVVTSLTAYVEFHGTPKKMNRYNTAIMSLQDLLVWWDTLSNVSKADLSNIAELVQTGEQIISGEFTLWMSHNPKMAGLSEKEEHAMSGGDKHGSSDENEKMPSSTIVRSFNQTNLNGSASSQLPPLRVEPQPPSQGPGIDLI